MECDGLRVFTDIIKTMIKIPRNTLMRSALFIATTVMLLFFLPKEAENEYSYEVNRPWAYNLLTAPFDIPVHPDSAHTRQVIDSIDATFEPIYLRDISIEKSMVSEFGARLNRDARELPPGDRNRMLAMVKNFYENGIVPSETYNEIDKGRLPSVRFIHDNMAISMSTESFISSRTAYARLDSAFRDQRFRKALATVRPGDYLQPNILPDTIETSRLLDEVYQKATAPIGVIQQGERIIDKGDIVTPQLASVLKTYEELTADRGDQSDINRFYPIAGQALYLIILLGVLYAYLYIFRRDYFDNIKILSFIMLMITGFTFFAYALALALNLGLYMVPFTMVPIMTVIFLDSRTALFVHVVMMMICAVIAVVPLEFVFMQFIAGTAAIDSIKDLSRRSQLIRTAVIVFLSYCLSYIAIEVMQNGNINLLSSRMFGYLGINAVLVSFAYILMFIFEKVFGFTSRVTLVELSDINNPLLRELSEECPGTFQHSMAVSNLASAAASRIGANMQLVRAGALYHDIGKTRNPAFFTENQHGINPHDALDPMQSARIVISHVSEGLKMADKAKLPQELRRFINEHHGCGKARYFYTTWCNKYPGEEPDEAAFTYPGPNPQSRETSILMMADSVEAASRSLTDHSPETITALVNRIIDAQIAEGLHNNSTISFRDVKMIKETFAQRLRTMYHSRISYPDLKKTSENTPAT